MRPGVAGILRRAARPSSPRRFPARGCWDRAPCGPGLLESGAVRLRPPHRGDSQQGVAGILRCAARGCWTRAPCGSGPRTAAILSNALPHRGDSQQRTAPQRAFPASVLHHVRFQTKKAAPVAIHRSKPWRQTTAHKQSLAPVVSIRILYKCIHHEHIPKASTNVRGQHAKHQRAPLVTSRYESL